MNFTEKNRADLEKYLANHDLPTGLGTKESACSVAAINLAISGELTDEVPACMSLALGRATIRLQDKMPAEMRNSTRYKTLLPHMAGTGREREKERSKVLLDWMWSTVLPQLQEAADKGGFGSEWRVMCKEKTPAAAYDAAAATYAATCAADAAYAYAAARAATYAATYAADAAAYAADASAAAYAAYAADAADARADFWEKVDPIGVLERATYLESDNG